MEYALIKNNKVENVIVADFDFIQLIESEWDHIERIDTPQELAMRVGIGFSWTAENGFVAPAPITSPELPQEYKITRLAFLNRFQDSEAIAIDLASIGSTPEAAAVRLYLKKVDAATYIDLQDQKTRNGVIALESLGLLQAGRALEILDAPIQPSERP